MPSTSTRCAATVAALCALAAGATVVRYETLDEMAQRVPVIVRGHVARSVSGWDDQHQRIWTWTEVVVDEAIKGDAKGVVLVKQPGGIVGDLGQRVEGAATFHDNERCVLFLEPAPDEPRAFRVSGLSAGKVAIVEHLGVDTAMRSTDGISFVAPVGVRAAPVPAAEFLGDPKAFVARMRAATGGGR